MPDKDFAQAVKDALSVLMISAWRLNRKFPHANLTIADLYLVDGRAAITDEGMLKLKCSAMRPAIGPFSAN